MATSKLLQVVSCALIVTACVHAQVGSKTESNWKFLTTAEDHGLEYQTYYDLKSVKRSANIVAVWIKQLSVFKNDEQKQRLIKSITENRKLNKIDTKGYEKYSFSKTLIEIDCDDRSGRKVAIKDFDDGGALLGEDAIAGVPFAPIRDGSLAGLLFEALCR